MYSKSDVFPFTSFEKQLKSRFTYSNRYLDFKSKVMTQFVFLTLNAFNIIDGFSKLDFKY